MLGAAGTMVVVRSPELVGWSLVAHKDYLKVGACVAVASHDDLLSVGDFDFLLVKDCNAAVIAEEADGEEGMEELQKDVRLVCGCWEARDIELAGVGGLDFWFVG
jgi:hypothetical protein